MAVCASCAPGGKGKSKRGCLICYKCLATKYTKVLHKVHKELYVCVLSLRLIPLLRQPLFKIMTCYSFITLATPIVPFVYFTVKK